MLIHSKSIFCKFYPSIQLNFFPHIDSKKVCTLIKHSVAKFSVKSSVQYTLTFITSLFEGMFSQSRNFYENNIILWYYQIRPKVVWEVHGAWIDGYDKNLLFFSVQCIIAKTWDSPPCYCCHLLQIQLKTIRKSYFLRILFQVDTALNGGHLGHHLHYFNLVNQTCECFILIVCIIWPLNINKKSKLKLFISSFFSELGLRKLTDGHLGCHLKISTF